jgi:hypothetical protein
MKFASGVVHKTFCIEHEFRENWLSESRALNFSFTFVTVNPAEGKLYLAAKIRFSFVLYSLGQTWM